MRTMLVILAILLIWGCGPKVCEKDLKICPDGTRLARLPEIDCQFPQCPISALDFPDVGEPCANESQCGSGLVCKEGVCEIVAENVCTRPRPETCWDSWEPVCGSDQVTYANACEACKVDKVLFWNSGRCPYTDCSEVPGICKSTDSEVCGDDGITYNNACNACASGAQSYSDGRC